MGNEKKELECAGSIVVLGPEFSSGVRFAAARKELIAFHPDGRITLGEGVTPDDGAKAMLDMLSSYAWRFVADNRQLNEQVTRLQEMGTRLTEENRKLRARPVAYVAGLVTDRHERILLVRHRVRGWELPGGKVEPGETWRDALARELAEETGLRPTWSVTRPYLIDGLLVRGSQWSDLVIVARGECQGEPVPSDQDGFIKEAAWFARDTVPGNLSDVATAVVIRTWAQTKTQGYDGGELVRMQLDIAAVADWDNTIDAIKP